MSDQSEIMLPEAKHTGFRMVGDMGPLFAALAKAQGDFKPIVRSKENTFFKSSYAELTDYLEATVPALSANGLCLMQPESRQGDTWEIRTILAHASGAFIEATATFAHGGDWQKLGSAMTYCRRYCAGGILSVAPRGEDDDGNAATHDRPADKPKTSPTPPKVQPKPAVQSAPAQQQMPPRDQLMAEAAAISAQQFAAQQQLAGQNALLAQQQASNAAAHAAEAIVNAPVEPATSTTPTTPPPSGERSKKESVIKMKGLIEELGMGPTKVDWCTRLLGKPPSQVTLEAEVQVLIADLEMRKAAT
jgi:hypothetical protein